MNTNEKINQLVDLMADLIPNVDRLTRMQEKTNIEMSEMRTSNMKLAEAIEKLIINQERTNIEISKLTGTVQKLITNQEHTNTTIENLILKMDQVNDFGNRLSRVEKIVFK